jgi:hypothetical protein
VAKGKIKLVDGVKQPALRMVQVIPINLIDGNTGLAGLTADGTVFTYTGTGWVKLNMVEVENDNKV